MESSKKRFPLNIGDFLVTGSSLLAFKFFPKIVQIEYMREQRDMPMKSLLFGACGLYFSYRILSKLEIEKKYQVHKNKIFYLSVPILLSFVPKSIDNFRIWWRFDMGWFNYRFCISKILVGTYAIYIGYKIFTNLDGKKKLDQLIKNNDFVDFCKTVGSSLCVGISLFAGYCAIKLLLK